MNKCKKCGFWDSDYEGCTCPSADKWYACPVESEKLENKIEFLDRHYVDVGGSRLEAWLSYEEAYSIVDDPLKKEISKLDRHSITDMSGNLIEERIRYDEVIDIIDKHKQENRA